MILLIDNYDSFTYNAFQSIRELGEPVEVFRNDKITLSEVEALAPSGIVLSPGPGRPEDAGICLDLVETFSGKTPILGICLGHQAIVVAFGGRVIRSGQIVHGKEAIVFHSRAGLYANMPMPFEGGRYHSLVVERQSLPGDLIAEAECGDGTLMGLRHREHQTFGVQFHPESILTPNGSRIFKNFLNECSDADRGGISLQESRLRLPE
jgi:anthranilate synthase/aminodeoxychorismate synthase-like glutamine amidotransferase